MTIRSIIGASEGYGEARFSLIGANPGVLNGNFESIATVTVGSGGASSLTFSDIPSGFQHLHVRCSLRSTDSGYASDDVRMRLNGNSGSNYSWHEVAAQSNGVYTGNGVTQTIMNLGQFSMPSAGGGVSRFSAHIIDILDYTVTTKAKTVRTLCGNDRNDEGRIVMSSGRFGLTDAITSLTLFPNYTTTFAQHSTAALYGVKAP
jgi:hypothetical protein